MKIITAKEARQLADDPVLGMLTYLSGWIESAAAFGDGEILCGHYPKDKNTFDKVIEQLRDRKFKIECVDTEPDPYEITTYKISW